MAILLKTENINKQVVELIYDKQNQFKKESGKCISLEKTIERLLKEAYLSSLKLPDAKMP